MNQMNQIAATVTGLKQLPASDLYSSRFALTSTSGRTYTVAQRRGTNDWACSCPGHIFQKGQRKPCKHLRALGIAA